MEKRDESAVGAVDTRTVLDQFWSQILKKIMRWRTRCVELCCDNDDDDDNDDQYDDVNDYRSCSEQPNAQFLSSIVIFIKEF